MIIPSLFHLSPTLFFSLLPSLSALLLSK
uniref:Uncharacterized protein n=1 Tax=Arundo donax TaxID=35708 RepID=A0A0A9ARM2_ARUDO